MKNRLTKTLTTLLVIVGIVSALIIGYVLFLRYCVFGEFGNTFETNSIADYGNIIGNFDNETPKKFIYSFFPEEIEPYFSQPQYHYKAIKGDSYAYEIALEFVIEDSQLFEDYVSEISKERKAVPFVYNQQYKDFTISNEYNGSFTPRKDEIAPAGIGKILVNESEQRIIYVATGTYDGGYASMDDLNYYWTRFKD